MPLKFINITSDNTPLFHSLMKDYGKELDGHQNRTTDPAVLIEWADTIIRKSEAESFRLLRLCYDGNEIIGFLYATIDQPNDTGYHRTGHGYIMEFYVLPEHRRKGYGSAMLKYIEQFFRGRGVAQIYLTAAPITGKPFWSATGFTSKGEFSPDNGQEIFEKEFSPDRADKANARFSYSSFV